MAIGIRSSAMMGRLFLIAISTLMLTCTVARGHEAGTTGFAAINIERNVVRYKLTMSSIPDSPLAQAMGIKGAAGKPKYELLTAAIAEKLKLIANGGSACQAGPRRVTQPTNAGIDLSGEVDFVCHSAIRKLTIRDDLFDVLGSDLHTLARIEWAGGREQFVFKPEERETTITLVADGGARSGGSASGSVGSFFALGVEHILAGYDHLLFLLALIIGGGSVINIIKIVTGFTVAHSVTLALAVLDVLTLPSRLVEALIALSIGYVAAENLFPRYAISRRWIVSFVFGAVHGFGFSSILREAGLSAQNIFWPLLGFNLGVEVGQAALVLIAMPIVIWLASQDWGRKVTMGVSAVVLLISAVLVIERAILQA